MYICFLTKPNGATWERPKSQMWPKSHRLPTPDLDRHKSTELLPKMKFKRFNLHLSIAVGIKITASEPIVTQKTVKMLKYCLRPSVLLLCGPVPSPPPVLHFAPRWPGTYREPTWSFCCRDRGWFYGWWIAPFHVRNLHVLALGCPPTYTLLPRLCRHASSIFCSWECTLGPSLHFLGALPCLLD